MKTIHKILYQDSRNLENIPSETSQEKSILFNNLEEIHSLGNNVIEVLYSNVPQSIKPSSYDSKQFLSETIEATPSPFFSNSVV